MSQPLVMKNQFGEESINRVLPVGGVNMVPLGGDLVLISAAGVPTSGGSGTGVNVAGKGSLYVNISTGLGYQQQGLISAPSWVLIESGNSSVIAATLTGLSAASGVLSASDSILQGFNKLAGNVAAHQANSTAPDVATLVTDFNALLAKLQAAHMMA